LQRTQERGRLVKTPIAAKAFSLRGVVSVLVRDRLLLAVACGNGTIKTVNKKNKERSPIDPPRASSQVKP